METPTKNKQYIGKIVIKGIEEVSVFGPTITDTMQAFYRTMAETAITEWEKIREEGKNGR